MPIGNSPEPPEYNKKEDRSVKLGDKVQEWWDNLDDNTKYRQLLPYYYSAWLLKKRNFNEMWGNLSWNAKVDMYIDYNEKDEYMSADELYDGGIMSNFDNENKKKE